MTQCSVLSDCRCTNRSDAGLGVHFAILVEDATLSDVVATLKMLKGEPLPELNEFAREARQLRSDRFDRYLIPYHQRLAFASRHLSREGFLN